MFFALFIQLAPAVRAQMDNTTGSSPQVTTNNGVVEGVNDSGVHIFRGVPFAQPPVNELRWKPPQPVKNWSGVREAKDFGPRCMQRPIFGDMVFRSDMSEDCLYLNVWTPTGNSDANLPVLVYFYGGGLMAGGSSEPRYDGESMARNKGIVTVTVNYRLSVFGFLSHPELTEESPHNASGNYGLLDQAAALKWVKDNISAFGGNPDKITIAGESAGSISVSAQMASPLSRDLFSAAVGESGSVLGALSAVPLKQGEENGIKFQESVGAGSLKELRSLPAQKILDATGQGMGGARFPVTVDGYFFPREPIEIYRAGQQADIPLFVGWNSAEMNMGMLFQQKKPTPENYKQIVQNLYGENADKILELYPGSTENEVRASATDLASDRFIAYSTWKWSDIHGKTSSSPVYRYLYAHPRPRVKSEKQEEGSQMPPSEGAVHSAEIEYIMGNLPRNDVYTWTEGDYQVSNIFQGYLANFVKNHDPNGLGLPTWKPQNSGDRPVAIHIDVDTYLAPSKFEQRHEFLDRLTYPEGSK